MAESVLELTNAKEIAEHVCRVLLGKLEPVPEFPPGDVPIPVVAKVYGKDSDWVRAGIISGWLPIGRATRKGKLVTDISEMDSRFGRINYQVSPRKLWEDTGYIWKGDRG